MYAYTQSFIENCFFRMNSCFDKISDQTFLNQPALLHLLKNFVNLFSDCKLSLSRGTRGRSPSQRPKESLGSLHAKCVIYTTKSFQFLYWCGLNLAHPQGGMFQGCVTAGRVVTPKHTQTSFLVLGNPQLSSPWALFPLLYVVEADCNYLI